MQIFVPITYPQCNRLSVISLSAHDVAEALNRGADISLECGFDGARWLASTVERREILRLLGDAERVVDRPYLPTR